MPVVVNAVAAAQHQHRLLRHLPDQSQPWRKISVRWLVQTRERRPYITVRQRPFEVRRKCESAEGARRRHGSLGRNLLVEVRQQPTGFRWRAEDFVAHALIHGQPRRQLYVVLLKTGEVRVALVSPKVAASRNTGTDIAQAEGTPV